MHCGRFNGVDGGDGVLGIPIFRTHVSTSCGALSSALNSKKSAAVGDRDVTFGRGECHRRRVMDRSQRSKQWTYEMVSKQQRAKGRRKKKIDEIRCQLGIPRAQLRNGCHGYFYRSRAFWVPVLLILFYFAGSLTCKIIELIFLVGRSALL